MMAINNKVEVEKCTFFSFTNCMKCNIVEVKNSGVEAVTAAAAALFLPVKIRYLFKALIYEYSVKVPS